MVNDVANPENSSSECQKIAAKIVQSAKKLPSYEISSQCLRDPRLQVAKCEEGSMLD
jgi:hypothetical protein